RKRGAEPGCSPMRFGCIRSTRRSAWAGDSRPWASSGSRRRPPPGTPAAMGIEGLESPLAPEDLDGHARLAAALDLPVAVGETLRTHYQFAEWLGRGALDIAQPDIARCGVTEGRRIAALAAGSGRPVALHLGVSLGVAMAATWQGAAALPNFS